MLTAIQLRNIPNTATTLFTVNTWLLPYMISLIYETLLILHVFRKMWNVADKTSDFWEPQFPNQSIWKLLDSVDYCSVRSILDLFNYIIRR